jgi:hypothetical protein
VRIIAAGPKALEPLRKAVSSESAEVRVRAAQAIKAIELAIKTREVYPDHKPLSLKKTATVGEILEELGRQTGAKFDASPEQRALKTTVDAATLIQALDQMCAGQERLTYAMGDDGTVRFLRPPSRGAGRRCRGVQGLPHRGGDPAEVGLQGDHRHRNPHDPHGLGRPVEAAQARPL